MIHVHAYEVCSRGGAGERLVIVALKRCASRGRRHGDRVDLAVLHRHGERVVVGEGGERHSVELRSAVPIVGVGLHGDVVLGNELDLLVGAGRGGVVGVIHALADVVDAQKRVAKRVLEVGHGLLGHNRERLPVGIHFLDGQSLRAAAVLRIGALPSGLDGRRVNRLAVRELDAILYLNRPGLAVVARGAFGKPGLGREVVAHLEEVLNDAVV